MESIAEESTAMEPVTMPMMNLETARQTAAVMESLAAKSFLAELSMKFPGSCGIRYHQLTNISYAYLFSQDDNMHLPRTVGAVDHMRFDVCGF